MHRRKREAPERISINFEYELNKKHALGEEGGSRKIFRTNYEQIENTPSITKPIANHLKATQTLPSRWNINKHIPNHAKKIVNQQETIQTL